MRYPVPQSTPTPNSVLIFDGSAGERGGTIDNTGGVDIYLCNKSTKAAMENSVDQASGIPKVGRKLSPGQTYTIVSCAEQIFAIAVGNGGETEVLDFAARLPCCS